MNKIPRPLLYLLAAGGLLRLLWVLWSPAQPVSDFATYDALAKSLLHGQALVSTYRVPGWPVVMWLVYRLFGEHLLAVKLLNVLMGTATIACTWWLADALQPAPARATPANTLAAGFVAFFPSLILYTALLASETLYIFLLVGSAALFAHALRVEKTANRLAWLAAAGVVLGLSALVRPLSLAVPAVWVVYAWMSARKAQRFSRAFQALLAGVIGLAAFAAWPIYAYTQTGRLIIQNNGGLNWYLGFNPRADGYYSGEVLSEFLAQAKADGLDEFQTDQRAYQLAFEYIRQNPLRAVALVPLKWFHLFKHDVSGVQWNYLGASRAAWLAEFWALVLLGQGYYLVFLGLTLAAAIAWLSGRNPAPAGPALTRTVTTPAALFAGGYIALSLVFHALTIGVDRYHLPLLPFMACLAGAWLAAEWARWAPDAVSDSPYQWKADPHSSHSLALAWLKRQPAEARILDIGCAQGRLGENCGRPPENLTGIEPNPAWAESARRWYGTVLTAGLDQAPDASLAGNDAVLLLDVLEHLTDAPAQLTRVAASLPPGGQILISIPNIAHLFVRLSLLLGRFDYAERGLLDRTHVHFYTHKSFHALLAECGLQIVEETATPVPLPLVSRWFSETRPGRTLHSLSAWAARRMPGLLGYQFVAAVRVKPFE